MDTENEMTGSAGGNPVIGILMGSESDLSVMEGAFDVLDEFDVPYEVNILSAHRTPEETAAYAATAEKRGLRIIIAGAGMAAHLAGVVASKTTLPVIGVPIDSSALQGLDALFSTVQMPPGIPVATMSIGKAGARNAAIFAVQVLSLNEELLAARLKRYKAGMAEEILTRKKHKLDAYLSGRKRKEPL